MVAIVTGKGMGLERSSAWVLGAQGQLGGATLGRDGESVYVNAANGNLVVTRQDEFLIGLGRDVSIGRTYNSQATGDGDNNDNWRASVYRKVTTLSGNYGDAGTTVKRTDWDGSETLYTWNATYIDSTHGAYVATDGVGAYDMLTRASGIWTWTDGDSQCTETYDENNNRGGRIATAADTDGNVVSYTYDDSSGLITRVTSENADLTNEYTDLNYSGTKLMSLVTGKTGGVTLKRVSYDYDIANRLTTVTVDLSPNDSAVSDGYTYVTTYTYTDSTSKRVASISQSDGSLLQIQYDGSNRVSQFTQTVSTGVVRTTGFDYSVAGQTRITDPAQQKTTLFYNANNELLAIGYPPEAPGIAGRAVQFTYNTNGDVLTAARGPADVVTYTYDAHGNALTERDSAGNSVERTYNAKNELRRESRYLLPDPASPLTTRYAYDDKSHLRFAVSAEGFVTEYIYDGYGRRTAAIDYAADAYDVSGLAATALIDRSALESWVTGIGDKSTARRTETSYDFRGNVDKVTSHAKLLSTGYFDTSSDKTETTYVYDQAGNLLSRVTNASSAIESFVYDGLNRMTLATDFSGAATRTTFLDALGTTVVAYANGLSEVSAYDRAGELIERSSASTVAAANLVGLSGWPANPASLPSGNATVSGWLNPTGFVDETIWAATSGPAGTQVAAIRSGQTDAGAEGGGNITNEVTIDGTKAYEFTYYFKLSDLNKHAIYFGLSDSGGAAFVESAATGADNANPYFFALGNTEQGSLTADRWYKVVGYVLAEGAAPIPAASLGGLYDTTTGLKVMDVQNLFRWNVGRPGNAVRARFFNFYGEANQQYSTYFHQPEIRQIALPGLAPADLSTSLYHHDNLGRLRMTVDPTGNRQYMMYDTVGRKIADIDADGSVIEYRYDGNDNLTSTTRYAIRLDSNDLNALAQANGELAFSGLRPDAVPAEDRWTFQVYDAAQRLVQTIDGTGATSVFTYDGASRLISTKSYFNRVSSTNLAALKAAALDQNLWTNPNDGSLWSVSNVTRTAADAIDGAPATKFAVTASGTFEAVNGNQIAVAAGDTVSLTLSLKGVGSLKTNSIGLYGDPAGWGANAATTAVILSGGGTLTQLEGGLWGIADLSTSEATRITITRTFASAGYVAPYVYINNAGPIVAGEAVILSAPVLTRTPTAPAALPSADAAKDRVSRSFYDQDGRLAATLDAAGGLTRTLYDKAGRKVRELGHANAASSSLWAAGTLDQLIASVGASSADRRIDYVYDARGFLRFTLDATARPTEMVYDAAGRVVRAVGYGGSIASSSGYSLSYVAAQLSSTALGAHADNRVSRLVYNAAGQAAFAIDAAGAVEEYAYDGLGDEIKKTAYATAYAAAGDPSLAAMQSWAASHAGEGANRVSRSVRDLMGRVAYAVDAENYVTERQYDAAGRLKKEIAYADPYTVADGATKASLAALIGTPPASAAATRYDYDADGRLSETKDGADTVTRFTYDSFGQPIDTILAYGTNAQSTTRRAYDLLGRLSSETRGHGTTAAATTGFAYDALGNLITVTDPLDHETKRTYDRLGRVLTISVPVDANPAHNLETSNEYDAFGDVVKAVDARGNAAFSYHDALGRIVLHIDQERYATATAYNVFGKIASVTRHAVAIAPNVTLSAAPTPATDAKDATTGFLYDKCDRLVRVTDAESKYEAYQYTAFGDRLRTDNKAGGITVYAHDRRGRLAAEYVYASVFDPDGSLDASSYYQTYLVYDSRGNVIWKTEALGLDEQRITGYTYDKANRLIQISHDAVQVVAANLITTATVTPTEYFAYNARGELIQSIDAGGGKTLSYHDALGRKTFEVSPVGTLSAWTYHADGNVHTHRVHGEAVAIPAEPGGSPPTAPASYRETVYGYDFAGRLEETSVNSLLTGEYSGGAYARTTGTVAAGTIFHKFGGVVQETDGRGNSTWTWHDKLGRKVAQVDRDNYLTVWTRNADGNAKSETRYATRITGSFDAETGVAALEALAGTDAAADRTTEFTYDRNGRRLTETRLGVLASTWTNGAFVTAAASATIAYTYNALGQVASRTEAKAAEITHYGYDAFGRLTSVKDPAITDHLGASVRRMTENFYDAFGRIVRIEINKEGGAAADDRVTIFAYGAGGRLAATTTSISATERFTRSFEYDAAGRVAKEWYERYKSDGTTLVREATGYRHDLAGRLVTQAGATWNGSAWSFGDATRLRYNAFGEVTGKGITGGPDDSPQYQEQFFYDAGGRLWKSTAGDGAVKIMLYDKAGNLSLTLSSVGADLSAYADAAAAATALLTSAGASNAAGAVSTILVSDRRGLQLRTIEPGRQLGAGAGAAIVRARTYNAFGEVQSETDPRGFDAAGDAIGFSGGAGYTTIFSYNKMGRLIAKVSPQISVTDEHGGVSNANPTEHYAYDLLGRLVGVTDALGRTTARALLAGTGLAEGEEALVTAEYHADLGVARTYYDVFRDARILRNELYTGSNAADSDEVYTYDKMGRAISVAHRGGLLVDSYVYDGLGRRTRHSNSQLTGAVERTDYDLQGRISQQIDMMGGATSYSYGWNGALATGGLGTFGGWVKTVVNLSSMSSTETLDYFGRTIARTDFGGHAYAYTFDLGARLTGQTGVSGQSMAYGWFNTGQLAQTVDTAGTGMNTVTATFAYDAAGNRTYEGYAGTVYSFHFTSGTTSATRTLQNATIAYDALGRITSFTDKDAANVTRITVTNEYDEAGNVRRVSSVIPNLAAGSGTLSSSKYYLYDTMNRMTVADGQLVGGAIVRGAAGVDIEYDAAGRRRTQTRDAGLTGSSFTWIWREGYGPGSGNSTQYPDEGVNGDFGYVAASYSGARREEYEYRADGSLATISFAQTGYADNEDGTVTATTIGASVLRAEYQRDALGRITRYREFAPAQGESGGAIVTRDRYEIAYDNRGSVTGEKVSQTRLEGGTPNIYLTYTDNDYANGLLTATSSREFKNGSNNAADDRVPDTSTTNQYSWWDDARLSVVTFDKDTGSSNSLWTSTYAYDGLGRIAKVDIDDERNRTVSFAYTPEGQVLSRKERASATATADYANPEDQRYFVSGRQIGEITNNGNSDPALADYAQNINVIRNWTPNQQVAAFRWNTSTGVTRGTFGPSAGYDYINPFGAGAQSAGSAYTVREGETLQSIAANVWGEASLWYLIAEANGLSGSAQLTAGQRLTVPDRVTNARNNASTFKVYDPNSALGDLSPTTAKPPKKPGCGGMGQILVSLMTVAIAAVITAVTGPIGGIVGKMALAAVANAAAQGIGVATGLQDKFSWKQVATSAITAGVAEGVNMMLPMPSIGGSPFLADAVRGMTTSAISQGIGVATGLQDRFSWQGVAAAGVIDGVSSGITRGLATQGWAGANASGIRNQLSSGIGAFGSQFAGAGVRSLMTGTSFGDNLMAVLPDVIGSTIGNMLGSAIQESASKGPPEDQLAALASEAHEAAHLIAAEEGWAGVEASVPQDGDLLPQMPGLIPAVSSGFGRSSPFGSSLLGGDGLGGNLSLVDLQTGPLRLPELRDPFFGGVNDAMNEALRILRVSNLNGYGYAAARGDELLLQRMIFSEAVGLPGEMPAIAWSIINRVRPNGPARFAIRSTLREVAEFPYQFSFLNGSGSRLWNDSATPSRIHVLERPGWDQAGRVARGVLRGEIPDPTGGATAYFANREYDGRPETALGGFKRYLLTGQYQQSGYRSPYPTNRVRHHFFVHVDDIRRRTGR